MTIDEVARQFTKLEGDRSDRFDEMAGAVFEYQRATSAVYNRYCNEAGIHSREAAFLPVEAFKYAPVVTFPPEEAQAVFESSGTGSGTRSRHYIRDIDVYERSVLTQFRRVFGDEQILLLAHLPGYAERGRKSSLLYMVEHLIGTCGAPGSGLFLDNHDLLHRAIERPYEGPRRLVLFGAAFGLLHLATKGPFKLPEDALVVETGGMKTGRREVSRDELHARLAGGFGLEPEQVWSEYGMCELLSQCYAQGGRVFHPPSWMDFRVVDPSAPENVMEEGEAGALALFDLANVYSVSAILTQDRAVKRGKGFEVLGRLSQAELRGCNFLIDDILF